MTITETIKQQRELWKEFVDSKEEFYLKYYELQIADWWISSQQTLLKAVMEEVENKRGVFILGEANQDKKEIYLQGYNQALSDIKSLISTALNQIKE